MIIKILILVIILSGLGIGLWLVQNPQIFNPRAATTDVDFYGKNLSFLGLLGQKKISETSRNKVTPTSIYHAAGVVVDRSSTPNRIYVADTGNNRILGFNNTNISNTRPADLVFGQDNFEDAACNKDNNIGFAGKPNANMLCLFPFPLATNIAEGWQRINFDVDSEGNLYFPDLYNNRILIFHQPFSSDKTNGKGDTTADFVIGQDDFVSNGRNRSTNYGDYSTISPPDNHSLWISVDVPGRGDHLSSKGVSVDNAGNVWVADTYNNRVLRFPKGQKNADLVLGQSNFSTNGCTPNGPLNKMCTPTLARYNAETDELFVLDEYPAPFQVRILVFKGPFTNGMNATRSIVPKQNGKFVNWGGIKGDGESYPQSTGFIFNTYKQGEYANGVIWLNDISNNRAVLLDNEGNVIKAIGALSTRHRGGDTNYIGCPPGIYAGNNLWAPGGSIGMDSQNNLYFADEFFHKIIRYSLPYNTVQQGAHTCLPDSSGGLFTGGMNTFSIDKIGETVGIVNFNNQLIYQEENRMKIWNNYLSKSMGAPADFEIIGNGRRRELSQAIDDGNRLWMFNEHGVLRVDQLPYQGANDKPLIDFIKLYWKDDGSEIPYRSYGGLAFDKINKKLYVVDNNRIFRISDYSDFSDGKLTVDMVIGQTNKTSTACNKGLGQTPIANGLCIPNILKFDNDGNLFVIENNYECHGNDRISIFLKEDLNSPTTLFPDISAKKVLVAPNLTSRGPCGYTTVDMPGSPVALAFNSKNQLVVGNDGYYGDQENRSRRQLWIYNDPLNNPNPHGYIDLPMGAPGEITFDTQDNLIIQDHTWSRIWLVNLDKDPELVVPLSNPDASPSPRPSIDPRFVIWDDFNRANSASSLGKAVTGQDWVPEKGTWGIINNNAYPSNPCPAPGMAVINPGVSDGIFQVKAATNPQDTTLVFRYSDLNNHYWLSNAGPNYTLLKKINGAFSLVGHIPNVTPSHGDVFKIEFEGSSIKVYINNSLALITTENVLTGNKVGIATWCGGAGRFEDMSFSSFTTPSPSPLPTKLADLNKNGSFDIDDINLFIQYFKDQDSKADLVLPVGIDVSDINAFIEDFKAI